MPIAVNPDLIERAESTPDTVLTLVDGHKLVVTESVDSVVSLVRQWRAEVAAEAFSLCHVDHPEVTDDSTRNLSSVTELTAEDAASHSLLAPSLARVLRMPKRED
jgi:flagellar protein FlbD